MFKRYSALAVMASAICLAFASPARADDDEGHGRRESRQEFRDGPCKVEREQKKNGDYKEKRECRGGAEYGREGKEEFRDGGREIKREWKKKGDFKEERKCKGGDRGGYPAAVVVPAAAVARSPRPAARSPAC